MAEKDESTDDSQKTEEPTARRLEEARKSGKVVYSREISNWVLLFAATLILIMNGPQIMSDLGMQMKKFIAMPHTMSIDGKGLRHILEDLVWVVSQNLALPFLGLIAAGVLSSLIQTGPILSLDPVKPDLSKISIFAGFSRLFSGRSIVEFIKGILKLLVVSIAVFIVIRPYFSAIDHFIGADIFQSMFDLKEMFLRMMIAVLSILFIIAILDYLYQRHTFMNQMRMSKQELKEEFKQTEGDPHIKGRLRELRAQRARQRMMQSVPKADVVITNPTHYAVALKYDTKEMDAPIMVAKGADAIAKRIKEVAKENKVPIVENAPLARALYDSMEIDDIIPHKHWKAVAEVISYVFRLRGKKV